MKKIIIICTMLSLFLPVMAKENLSDDSEKNYKSFEREMGYFRYSLYKDIKPFDYQGLSGLMDFEKTDNPLNEKCKAFYNKHQDKIKNFKIAVLQKHQSTTLDLDRLKIAEDLDEVARKFSEILSNKNKMKDISKTDAGKIIALNKSFVMKVYFINPIAKAQFIRTFLLARVLGPKRLAEKSLKNNLAWPLIKTEKINDHTWKIIVDEYEHVYYFTYDLDTDVMVINNVYQR